MSITIKGTKVNKDDEKDVGSNLKDSQNSENMTINTTRLLKVLPGLETYQTPNEKELVEFMRSIYPFRNLLFNCVFLMCGIVCLFLSINY